MKKRNVAVVAIAIAALLVAGSLTASNMGFKLNRVLNGTGSSATGQNYVALPFNKQVGMGNATDLIDDLIAAGGSVAQVSRFANATDDFEAYTGTAGTPFALSKDEGYVIGMNGDLNYIIVGSHDPGHVVSFNGTGTSATGQNYYALPYHTTAASAKDLIDELTAAGGNVAQISRFANGTDDFEAYTGTAGSSFPLVPGVAYVVGMNNDLSFTPSHY